MADRDGARWRVTEGAAVGLAGSAWDRTVLALETGTMFHTSAWVEAIARGFGRSSRYFAFLDSTGNVRGLLPVVQGRSGPFRTAYSPITIVTPYGGPACAVEDLGEALKAAHALMKAEGWDYLRLALPPRASASAEAFAGFELLPGTTRIVPLGSEDTMWRGLNRRCRRYIAKSQGAGVQIRDVPDFGFLDAYLTWGERTYGRTHEEFPPPREFYAALRDLVKLGGDLFVRGAFLGERPVTVEFFGLARGTLYAIDSAMDREAAVDGAGNQLTWDTMRVAASRGAREFDLLGTNLPRIAEYKESFGGSDVPAHNLESMSRAFRVARRLVRKR